MGSSDSLQELLDQYEIVFSCAICQATITDLYRRPRTDHGFSSNSAEKESVVTKLWLTECGHLTCSDHLDGGGAPFHPKGERPKAPCPLCRTDKGDNRPKVLHSIVGLGPEEHDKQIPDEYFVVPASKLDDSSKSSAALQFQYSSVVRYAQSMHKKYIDLHRTSCVIRAQAKDFATSARESRNEAAQMRAKIEKLEEIEARYAKYKKREPEIRHYLGNCAALANENNLLKTELQALGYHVPQTVWAFDAEKPVADGQVHDDSAKEHLPTNHKTQYNSSSSSRKRTRDEYRQDHPLNTQLEQPLSMAPPRPRLPLQSVYAREINAQRIGSKGAPESRSDKSLINPEVEIYSGGQRRAARRSDEQMRLRLPQHQDADEAYMMSGALSPRVTVHGLRDGHRGSSRHYGGQECYAQAREILHRPETGYMPAKSASRPQLTRDNELHCNDGRPYVMKQIEQHQSLQAPSQSSLMWQPQALNPSNGNARQRESDYQTIAENYELDRTVFPREAKTPKGFEPLPEKMVKTRDSPFFQRNRYTTQEVMQNPMSTRSMQMPQPEQLVSGLQDLRMKPAKPSSPVKQSLNALSFIAEPYTASNKPVFTRPASRPLLSRAASHAQNARHTTHPDLQRSYIQDPIYRSNRLTSAAPSITKPSRQTFSRNELDSLVNPMKGVQAPSYLSRFGMNTSPTTIFPYQQQRGLYTAGGRRSVRR